MLQTKEFSVFVKKLPKLTKDFTIDMLKSDLWTHIEKVIRKEPQKIHNLKDNACEIVDIQFAMSNYQNLEKVKKISKLADEIIRCDHQLRVLDNEDTTSNVTKISGFLSKKMKTALKLVSGNKAETYVKIEDE